VGITIDEVRNLALSLPETKEENHWGKPSFRVRGKIYAVIQEDQTSLVAKTTKDQRLANTTMAPDIYSVPDRFQNLNYMKVRIDRIPINEFRSVLIHACPTLR
jgi:hypothetical protein